MAEIARQIDTPHATIRNYFQGRMPAPEVLIKIANETGVSLNWLLTGNGEMFIADHGKIDLDRLLESRISRIIDKKLVERSSRNITDLGRIDAMPKFDLVSAIEKFDNPHRIMTEWFRFEKRRPPQDYGVVFFQGWESYTSEEKEEALRDAKKVLDRTLKKRN